MKKKINIRKEEIQRILKELKVRKFSKGLEIGAGSGFQSSYLKKVCDVLVVTEYNDERLVRKKGKNVQYKICDAQNLPFSENTFDFVYSSNVMEHIINKKKCLKSIKKVSKPGTLMVHLMPTRVCKLSQVFFYYVRLIHILFSRKKIKSVLDEKKEIKAKNKLVGSNVNRTGGRSLIKCIFPPVHGSYNGHIQEFIMNGKNQWIKKFKKNGYEIVKIVKMPFFFNSGYDIKILRKFLNAIGLSSSYAYFVRIKNEK